MLRVTIQDEEQTISFLTSEETLQALVAGCSVNPANLGDLLVAAEIYQLGIASKVMADLIEFDKTLRQKGSEFIQAAIEQARGKGQAFEMTFQVSDEITAAEAFQPRECELATFDLARQVIHASKGLDIPTSGEVQVNSDREAARPTVTYVLPQIWQIQDL